MAGGWSGELERGQALEYLRQGTVIASGRPVSKDWQGAGSKRGGRVTGDQAALPQNSPSSHTPAPSAQLGGCRPPPWTPVVWAPSAPLLPPLENSLWIFLGGASRPPFPLLLHHLIVSRSGPASAQNPPVAPPALGRGDETLTMGFRPCPVWPASLSDSFPSPSPSSPQAPGIRLHPPCPDRCLLWWSDQGGLVGETRLGRQHRGVMKKLESNNPGFKSQLSRFPLCDLGNVSGHL